MNSILKSDDTKAIKGIAILLMIVHHLFSFPDRIKDVSYISLFSLFNKPIEVIIGEYGKICVSIFLFMAGYSMYYSLKKQSSAIDIAAHRLRRLFENYFVVFALFVPVRFIIFNYDFRGIEFIKNLLCISSSYNGEWWFMSMYIVCMLCFAIFYNVYKNINKNLKIAALLSSFILLSSVIVIGIFMNSRLIIKGVMMFFCYEGAFFLGYIFARYDIFSKFKEKEKAKLNKISAIIMSIFIIIITVTLAEMFYYTDIGILIVFMTLTPIVVYISYSMLYYFDNGKIYKILKALGENSTSMWLIHTFFCYYYCQKFIFCFRYSILIYIVLIIISFFASQIIDMFIIKKIFPKKLN